MCVKPFGIGQCPRSLTSVARAYDLLHTPTGLNLQARATSRLLDTEDGMCFVQESS